VGRHSLPLHRFPRRLQQVRIIRALETILAAEVPIGDARLQARTPGDPARRGASAAATKRRIETYRLALDRRIWRGGESLARLPESWRRPDPVDVVVNLAKVFGHNAGNPLRKSAANDRGRNSRITAGMPMANAGSRIPTLLSQRQQVETRFVELMSELFQLDEAEALDFGLYRVIRRHHREVRAFLGEIVGDHQARALRSGRLGELLDAVFATTASAESMHSAT